MSSVIKENNKNTSCDGMDEKKNVSCDGMDEKKNTSRDGIDEKNKATLGSKILTFVVITAAIIELICIAFCLYASEYYRMDDKAKIIMLTDNSVVEADDYVFLEGDKQGQYIDTNTLYIFYPGAKVEYTSYLPLMKKLQAKGISCALIRSPFNMAMLNKDMAKTIKAEHPDYDHYIVGGHSFGGATATSFYAEHEDEFDAAMIVGAYIYGDVTDRDKVLIEYGSLDGVLHTEKIEEGDNCFIIEGGNHCQFGDYGYQKHDGYATISREEQQNLAVDKMIEFLENEVF